MVRTRYRGPAARSCSMVKNGRRLRKYSQWLRPEQIGGCDPLEVQFNASRCRRAARALELLAMYEWAVTPDPIPEPAGWELIPTSVEEDPERWDGLS
jgi:hypothetical protein